MDFPEEIPCGEPPPSDYEKHENLIITPNFEIKLNLKIESVKNF